MLDVVCIGAATEDIFFFSDRFKIEDRNLNLPWKEKLAVDQHERSFGGGAFHASVAFNRLGLKAAFFGRVGTDRAGQAIRKVLEKEGVSTEFLVTDPEVKTSTSALLSSGGERTIVMYRGENDNLLETKPDWSKIMQCRWVFLADLAGTNDDLLFEVIRQIGKSAVKLAYVPGQREITLGKEKLKPALAAAEILILNFYEAQMIFGGEQTIKEMLITLKNLGVGIPIITQDVEGSFAFDGSQFYHQESVPEVKVVERTGAGDAFSATFTAGIILGKSISESLLLAAKNASSVITKVGGVAGLLSLTQL